MYVTNFPHKQSRLRYKQNKDPNVGGVYISNFIHQHLALKDKSIMVTLYCNATDYSISFDSATRQIQLTNHSFKKNSVKFELKSHR